MNRSLISMMLVLAISACWGVACSTPLYAESSQRPNFVIIMADDLGYGDLSCYVNTRYDTPHLDALASRGLKFTDFHSNGNVCSPTRAALLTGRYQQRAGIPMVVTAKNHRHVGLQTSETTFAEVLGDAGYKTAMFGKWHLGYQPKYNPVHQGFGEFRGYVSGNVDYFSHIDQTGIFDWWVGDQLQDEEGYTTHLITGHAVRFIEQTTQQPFCVYVAHEAPHYPYQGPNDKPERTRNGTFVTSGARQDVAEAYREMVQEMDRGIGEVVQALEDAGVAENTLLLFFSDNGANARGNNGELRGTKGSNWEGGHRVPCLAYWPGTVRAGETDQLTITMDIMPTMLEAADIPINDAWKLDGRSFLSTLYGHTSPTAEPRTLVWNGQAVRWGNWKYLRKAKGMKGPGLFDLSGDLGEQINVISKHQDIAQKLEQVLEHWISDVEKGATVQPQAK